MGGFIPEGPPANWPSMSASSFLARLQATFESSGQRFDRCAGVTEAVSEFIDRHVSSSGSSAGPSGQNAGP